MTNNQHTRITKNDSPARTWVSVKLAASEPSDKPAPPVEVKKTSKSSYAAALMKKIHHLVADFPIRARQSRLSASPSTQASSGVLEVAQLWAAAYFLPLLDSRAGAKLGVRESFRLDDLNDQGIAKIRIVTRPTEALRLPSIFFSRK